MCTRNQTWCCERIMFNANLSNWLHSLANSWWLCFIWFKCFFYQLHALSINVNTAKTLDDVSEVNQNQSKIQSYRVSFDRNLTTLSVVCIALNQLYFNNHFSHIGSFELIYKAQLRSVLVCLKLCWKILQILSMKLWFCEL